MMARVTLLDIENTLRAHKEELRKRFGVSSIAIFGSYARGEQTELSDVDILVEFERPIGWEIVDLKDYLESLLGVEVDLVTKNAITGRKRLWEHIRRELVYV
jgi:predicted nucleotidyltransferase